MACCFKRPDPDPQVRDLVYRRSTRANSDCCHDLNEVTRRLTEVRQQNDPESTQQWIEIRLWDAAFYGQFEVCQFLLEEGGNPTWKKDDE